MRRRQPLSFLSGADREQVSLLGYLGRAKGALKCHARNSDGDAAVEVLSVSSWFRVDRLVLVRFGRLS